MKQIYLVCNAHVDPVWQWEWDEGLAEALSSFYIAANFCDKYDGFVFNHNEALLYQWVEEYDPVLFTRIQKLVAAGKWHIMGGWYLQPDCNMPSGESIVRQITFGRKYFMEKFGVMPAAAMNVDSFGHDRGLVQIMVKSGFQSYLIGRPPMKICNIPAKDFLWKGYDGSTIKVHLSDEGYTSFYGRAAEKIRSLLSIDHGKNPSLILWGVGNHGGGPSQIDLQNIAKLQQELADTHELLHSTPEAYFNCLRTDSLPVVENDLSPVMVGCYTSQVRIKQLHRQVENELYQTEKMAFVAEQQYGAVIDWEAVRDAEQTLLFNEFHDILPGSTVQKAEKAAICALGGALDALKKQKIKAFISMALHHKAPTSGMFPVFIYNSHPWKIFCPVECEFQLADENRSLTFTDFDVFCNGMQIPSQMIKEDSNIPIDWRKRLVFQVELEPFSMKFLECRPKTLHSRPVIVQPKESIIHMENKHVIVEIDTHTGLVSRYCVDGKDLLKNNSFKLAIVQDDEDPWGMRRNQFAEPCDAFCLATEEEAGHITAQSGAMKPVRIIEQGNVKTVVEAVFTFRKSFAVVRYSFYEYSTELSVDLELLWQEPSLQVKMEVPTTLKNSICIGEGMFGYRKLSGEGMENVAQKWLGVLNGSYMVSLINTGTYGSSFHNGLLCQTLLRSPAYCAHPMEDRQIIPDGRYFTRIDIGKRNFHFVLNGGKQEQQLTQIQQNAQIINEKPVALPLYTHGDSTDCSPFLTVESPTVILSALKRSIKGDGCILRLYHCGTGMETTVLTIPSWSVKQPLTFGPFEVKTLRYANNKLTETSIDEIDRQV